MPLGSFERAVLRLLAVNRNPDSYVAGATVLHQAPDSPRSSEDLDLFHDDDAAVLSSANADEQALLAAGYVVQITGPTQPGFVRAIVSREGQQTKIEWVRDSAFRFFPVERDPDLGWHLNFWDAATNKLLAFAGRMKLRDYIDVMYLHAQHLHLGALAWAAAGKDPGMTPEWIVDWGGRQARLAGEEVEKLRLTKPIDLKTMRAEWRQAAEEALALFEKLPPMERGCFHLDSSGQPVFPNPASPDFTGLTRHYGSLKGAWPRIVES